MKNILLLIMAVCSLAAHAQKIDQKLLTGRWHLYSVHKMGVVLLRDSGNRNVTEVFRAVMERDTTHLAAGYSREDSLQMVGAILPMFEDLFNVRYTFDGKGAGLREFPARLDDPKTTGVKKETATYTWTDANTISESFSELPAVKYRVKQITAKRLTLEPIGDEPATDQDDMIFTRE